MKKATQKTIFKLLSLVLTLAMVFAVATIPTLTASADEVVYVTNKTIDFEEGTDTSKWTFGTGWSVDNAPSVSDEHGAKSLKQIPSGQVAMSMKDVYLKAGSTYNISFYYYVVADEGATSSYWFNFGTIGKVWNETKSFSGSTTSGEWKYFSCDVTPTENKTNLTFNANITGCTMYLDDMYIFDKALLKTDVVAESATSLKYEYDETLGAPVAILGLKSTNSGTGFYVPCDMKSGKTYSIVFKYKSNAVVAGTNNWFRVMFQSDTSTNLVGTGNANWTIVTKSYTPSQDVTYIRFDSTLAVNVCLSEFAVFENTNTAVSQTYDFDKVGFSSAVETAKYSIKDVENNKVLCLPEAGAKLDAKLDHALTVGKLYKLSFDYKGTSNLRLMPNSGGWAKERYSAIYTISADTYKKYESADWTHIDIIFYARYASTHMYFYADAADNFLIDNFKIEETVNDDAVIEDFEGENATSAFGGYSVVDDPTGAENKVIKTTGTGYSTYSFPDVRFLEGHTYYVSFDYYAGSPFCYEVRTAANGDAAARTWPGVAEKNVWKRVYKVITPSEESYGGAFAILSRYVAADGYNYFDNFYVADITDLLAAESADFDFEKENQIFYENVGGDVTFENDAEYGRVANIKFNKGSDVSSSKIKVPVTLKENVTYKVDITYKADAWTGISWADKDNAGKLGDHGINFLNEWSTETRYVTGANDMLYFFVVQPEMETNITIANITVTPAGGLEDINGDGELNAFDITLMRNRILGARDDSKLFEKYADNNADTVVDIRDLVTLNNRTK